MIELIFRMFMKKSIQNKIKKHYFNKFEQIYFQKNFFFLFILNKKQINLIFFFFLIF